MKTILYALAIFSLLNCNKNKSATHANLAIVEEPMVATKSASYNAPPPPPSEISKENVVSAAMEVVDSAAATVDADVNFPDKTKPENQTGISKKIIKNGDMMIDVADIKSAQEKVQSLVKSNKGYIQNENYSNDERETTVSMEIRIPNQNFDGLINSFSDGIGSITQKNIRVEDVTEEYTDVSIRLKNKLTYLEKYRDLLKRSASTKDLLEIQEKIRGLEEEIESSEGRLRFIDDQVNYSTLNLTLTKEKPRNTVTSKIGFGSRFVDSIANGWNIFVNFILSIVSFWPFLLLIPLVIFLFKKWRKNRKSKK